MHLSLSVKLNISTDRDRSHAMAKWIDDEFERRKEQARRDKVLEAKASSFWDELANILEEDAEAMKRKLQVDVKVEQPTSDWIKLEKVSPLPMVLINLHLEPVAKSIKIVRQNRRGTSNSKPERLSLELGANDEPCVSIDGKNASFDEVSEYLLKPFLGS